MAKQVLISSASLAVGESVRSETIEVSPEISTYTFSVRVVPRRPGTATQVRIGISDHSTAFPREFQNRFLDDATEESITLTRVPARFQIEAACLIGTCTVVAETTLPEGGLLVGSSNPGGSVILPPPPPNYYLGTDALGNFGYFPLPGTGGSGHVHVWNEVPQGTVNGSNRVFTITSAPVPASSLTLALNGAIMRAGVGEDFVLSGSTITYSTSQIPQVGDTHVASYTVAAP
jgi:hypothetical protein